MSNDLTASIATVADRSASVQGPASLSQGGSEILPRQEEILVRERFASRIHVEASASPERRAGVGELVVDAIRVTEGEPRFSAAEGVERAQRRSMLGALLFRRGLPLRVCFRRLLLLRRELVVDLRELLVLLAGLRDQLLQVSCSTAGRWRDGGWWRDRRCRRDGRAVARGLGTWQGGSGLRRRGRRAFDRRGLRGGCLLWASD